LEKGINLSLIKPSEFEALLEKTINKIGTKKLSLISEMGSSSVGNHIEILSDEEIPVFWIGNICKGNKEGKSCFGIKFDGGLCPVKSWDKLNKLIGTSGKYYSEAGFDFANLNRIAFIIFPLKDEYLKQLNDESIDQNAQAETLVEFINEVLGKL